MSVPLTLAFDVTGLSPDNLITDEVHNLKNTNGFIVPVYGLFFDDSLKVVNLDTGTELTKNVDYRIYDFSQRMGLRTGVEVSETIIVYVSPLPDSVSISYQAVGGHTSANGPALIEELESKEYAPQGDSWDNLIGKPTKFNPAPHLHIPSHVYGWEYIVDALNRLPLAITTDTKPIFDSAVSQIKQMLDTYKTEILVYADTAINNGMFRLRQEINAAFIGLPDIRNYRVHGYEIGKLLGVRGFDYTIYKDSYISTKALQGFKETMYDSLVNSNTSGLGLPISNFVYPIRPNLLSMKNGDIVEFYSKVETPFSTRTMIMDTMPEDTLDNERLVVIKLMGSTVNYSGVWLGINKTTFSVYIGHALNDTCDCPINWVKQVSEGDLSGVDNALDEHIKTYGATVHRTTKDQVDLGNVLNLPVISEAKVKASESAYAYVTLDTLMLFTIQYINGGELPFDTDSDDSTKGLMDAAQIIFTACKDNSGNT